MIKDCRRYNDFGCYACQCGYYITDAKSCRKYEDGCMKYYRSMCTECMPHFKLRGGVCMIDGCLQHQDHKCVTCSDNYDLVNGICEFKNCFNWSEDTCLICKKGFNLVSGKCLETVEKFVCSSSVVLR